MINQRAISNYKYINRQILGCQVSDEKFAIVLLKVQLRFSMRILIST